MFDTYRAVNALKDAGFDDDQAVAVVSIMAAHLLMHRTTAKSCINILKRSGKLARVSKTVGTAGHVQSPRSDQDGLRGPVSVDPTVFPAEAGTEEC